jgi:DNA-binding MarR family transcriptional regulator
MESRGNLLWLLKGAFHSGRRIVDEAVRVYGVTAAQLGVLNRLAQHPGLSGAQLARQMLITPQAAQLALTTLEQRGLIERTPDPNHGRILRATLTKEGRRVARVCMATALAAEEKLFGDLTTEERGTLSELLQRVIDQSPAAANGGRDGEDGL